MTNTKRTHEECLDRVLSELDKEYRLEYESLQSRIEFEYRTSIVINFLVKLEKDGFVSVVEYDDIKHYSITTNGKIFLRDGGYVQKKKDDELVFKNSIETLDLTRKNYFWVKVTVALAIIAILISLFK